MVGYFFILSGPVGFWSHSTVVIQHGGKVGAVLLAIGALLFVVQRHSILHDPVPVTLLGLTLSLFFFSGWHEYSYNLIQGPTTRGELLFFGFCGFCIAKWSPPKLQTLLFFTLGSLALLIGIFFLSSRGEILFSDDNPTFLYRLILLNQNFPFIPFYNPLWNAGMEARDFFATGALNVYLLSTPLLVFLEPQTLYRFIHPTLLFLFLPICIYYAARLFELPKSSALLSSVLAVAGNLAWYRWSLQYGTLGFVTSSALVPLVLGVVYRFLSTDIRLPLAVAAVFLTTLMLFWTPTGLIFVPAFLIGLTLLPKLLRKTYFVPVIVVLALLNLPWIVLFWSASGVGSFLSSEAPSFAQQAEMAEASQLSDAPKKSPPSSSHKSYKTKKNLFHCGIFRLIREAAVPTNPLILLFGAVGILLLRPLARLTYLFTGTWLVFLGGVIALLKPQLELDRMLVILTLLLSIPAGAVFGVLWEERAGLWRKVGFGIAFAYLVVGLLSVGSILLARTRIPIYFEEPEVVNLTRAIQEHAREGRVLFSGFVLHELSHGHVAPLAGFTGVPLMASSPVHSLWRYQQIFPAEFLHRGEKGILEYLGLFNVSAVTAHERYWKEYFLDRPDFFHLEWKGKRFWLFSVTQFQDSYFFTGSGRVLFQNSSSIRVRIDSPSAVLKFRYLPFLTSTGCQLREKDVSPSVSFVELFDCRPGETVEIRALDPIHRLSSFMEKSGR